MSEAAFYDMHNQDQMAVDKLKEGIEGFEKVRHLLTLASVFQNRCCALLPVRSSLGMCGRHLCKTCYSGHDYHLRPTCEAVQSLDQGAVESALIKAGHGVYALSM